MHGQLRVARMLLAVVIVATGPAACGSGPATTRMGLSTDFRPVADELLQFVGEELSQARDDATHDANVSEARRLLADLRPKAVTEADRNVVLLLAMLMAKDNERLRLVFATRNGVRYESLQSDIATLYAGRDVCHSELLGWLGRKPTERLTLERGPCLAEAQQAAALLGK